MNTLARLFQVTAPSVPRTSPLLLTHSDISLLSWCQGLDLAMPNPSHLFQPLINNEPILVSDSEQHMFDSYMHALIYFFGDYYEHEDADGIAEGLFGGQISEVQSRRAYVSRFVSTMPELQCLPMRLRPLQWDFDAMFGGLDLQPLDMAEEAGLADLMTEAVGERIDTAALVTLVDSPAEDAECPICMDNAGEEGFVKPKCCVHAFHLTCLDEWINGLAGNADLCPLCRKSITPVRRKIRVMSEEE